MLHHHPPEKDISNALSEKQAVLQMHWQTWKIGDTVGFRGPYGNTFPIEEWEGKNLLYIAGGIALPPMRCVIWNTIDLREKYKDITIVYGARTVSDLVYKHELKEWEERPDIKLITTVDPGWSDTRLER